MFRRLLKDIFKENSRRGFSLVEIMVAITILAMIMGGASLAFMNYLKKSRVKQAGMDIKTLSNALDLYKTEFGKYPDSEGGLEALVKEGFLRDKKIPRDPWKSRYIYIYPGVNNTDSYDLYSFGPDAKEGGGDDIGNWEESGE